jgi:hypothetical protein
VGCRCVSTVSPVRQRCKALTRTPCNARYIVATLAENARKSLHRNNLSVARAHGVALGVPATLASLRPGGRFVPPGWAVSPGPSTLKRRATGESESTCE